MADRTETVCFRLQNVCALVCVCVCVNWQTVALFYPRVRKCQKEKGSENNHTTDNTTIVTRIRTWRELRSEVKNYNSIVLFYVSVGLIFSFRGPFKPWPLVDWQFWLPLIFMMVFLKLKAFISSKTVRWNNLINTTKKSRECTGKVLSANTESQGTGTQPFGEGWSSRRV